MDRVQIGRLVGRVSRRAVLLSSRIAISRSKTSMDVRKWSLFIAYLIVVGMSGHIIE